MGDNVLYFFNEKKLMKKGSLNKPAGHMALTRGLRKNVTNVRRKFGLMIGLSSVSYG